MVRIPKYRKHSSRDYAIVEIQGERKSLPGKYNSHESRAAYAEIVRAILADEPVKAIKPEGLVTIADLIATYLDHAKAYYLKKEYVALGYALDPVNAMYQDLPAAKFTPSCLENIRKTMVSGAWIDPPRPWARRYINHQINRIRRAFRWGVLHDLVPADVLTRLEAVGPLKAGRTAAKESPPVVPVDSAYVEEVAGLCSPTLAAMIRLQHLTGMRSQNVCAVRPCDIDQAGDVWLYIPQHHKRKWAEQRLYVYLGPKSQRLLLPFLNRPETAYLFSPLESEAWRSAQRREARKTKVQPSQTARRPKKHPRLKRRDHYDTDTYRQAINYAISRANRIREARAQEAGETEWEKLPHWHPHQLRHTRATLVRQRYKLEGAQVFLGHVHADVTQIYAERDVELGCRIAADIG